MHLDLENQSIGGVCVIAARGEIDRSSVARFSDALRRATLEARGHVAVDLRGVTFLDSSGISVLLNSLRRLARRGRRLALVCNSSDLLRLFELTGLRSAFDIYPTRTAALSATA